MDIRLRLANFRWFWAFKRYAYLVRFNVSKRAFATRYAVTEKRKSLGFVSNFFRVSLFSFVAALAAAWALYELDNLFLLVPVTFPVPSPDRYIGFLVGVAQLGGVFIGLYYAGMTTVAGTIYAQTPSTIRNLLVRERTGGVYMVYLTFVTFLPIVLSVATAISSRPVPRLAMPSVGLFAGMGIIAFVQLGRRAFELFDPTNLSVSAFDDLIYWTQQASVRGHHWHDKSFQKHANKRATEAIDVLETLADYSNRRENLRPRSFISLTSNVLRYLVYYQGLKSSIPRQSLWYERTLSHPDWFRSPDSSVQIASRTGTTVQPQEVPMADWVEDKLEPLVIQCFRANAASSNLSVLLELSSLVKLYVASLANAGQVARAIKIIGDFTQLLYSEDLKKSLTTAELAGFADFTGYLAIQVLLSASIGAGDRFPDLHSKRLRTIKWSSRDSIYSAGFSLSNLEQLEWLHERVASERSIEGERLTPDWYCLDMMLLADSRAIRDIMPQLLEIDALFLKPARELASECPFSSAALLSRCLEYLAKLSHHLQTYRRWHDAIIAARTLSDLPWPKLDFSEWEKTTEQREIAAHEQIARMIPAIIDGTKDSKLPDYRGQFIQVVANDLLQRMMDGNTDVVRKVFPLFWLSSFALFDALRPTVPPDATHILQNELHVASAPIIDLMDLSGYALLLSEYHHDLPPGN